MPTQLYKAWHRPASRRLKWPMVSYRQQRLSGKRRRSTRSPRQRFKPVRNKVINRLFMQRSDGKEIYLFFILIRKEGSGKNKEFNGVERRSGFGLGEECLARNLKPSDSC